MEYERPAFLIKENYERPEDYLSLMYGGSKVVAVCDYCRTPIELSEYEKSEDFVCESCGAKIK